MHPEEVVCPICEQETYKHESKGIQEQGSEDFQTVWKFVCIEGHVFYVESWAIVFHEKEEV